jgi:hypothetical protein
VLADMAVNYVERFALLCGYSVERVRGDYGIDLLVFTYDSRGFVENGPIPVQVKALGPRKRKPEAGVAVRIDRRDWEAGSLSRCRCFSRSSRPMGSDSIGSTYNPMYPRAGVTDSGRVPL